MILICLTAIAYLLLQVLSSIAEWQTPNAPSLKRSIGYGVDSSVRGRIVSSTISFTVKFIPTLESFEAVASKFAGSIPK